MLNGGGSGLRINGYKVLDFGEAQLIVLVRVNCLEQEVGHGGLEDVLCSKNSCELGLVNVAIIVEVIIVERLSEISGAETAGLTGLELHGWACCIANVLRGHDGVPVEEVVFPAVLESELVVTVVHAGCGDLSGNHAN